MARAAELGMSALAVTDHGNVSAHVRLEKAALKAGIKPIFGCELYTGGVSEDTRSKFKWHLTVLAENAEGYRNLLRLVSRGWAEGMYYEPTVSGEMLAEHSEGLVVLSGCSGSKIVCDLLGGKGVEEHSADYRAAKATALRFQSLLGDRYYLETQAFPELDRTQHTNQALERIATETGIPLVATGDVHYPRPDDSDMQVILHAAHRGSKSFEDQARSWGYDVKLAPPLSDKAVVERLVATGMSRAMAEGAVNASATISDRCNVALPKAERLRYPCPDGFDSVALFRRWIVAGWKYRGVDQHPRRDEYKERLNYEMRLIESKDFVDYFLLISDAVRFAKDAGIPVGPARGSAAASLVCYLLRITEVNPMDFPTLMFERFIDATREDPPDIDLDFADDRRDEVRQYLARKYGEDRIGNIGNFVKYRGKNSIDDVARVYRVPKYAAETVKGLVLERSSGDSRLESTLSDTEELFPAARAIFDQFPDLRQAFRLEGDMRGMSIHAAGLVVGASPLTDVCAVYTKKRGSDGALLSVLSIDKYDAEWLEILKIDALGLSTMGMISIALDLAGLTLDDLYAIELDDEETLEAFRRNDVVGIFQFEGRATRLVNKDVKPDNFMELADANALSRPGPLFSGVTSAYIDVKQGRKEPEFLHEVVSEATKATKGQIVYQEQILRIVKEIGGFPVTKVSDIRRIISKKLGEGQFHLMFDEFVKGAEERYGISPELAKTIWSKMVTSAQYSFVTAHAVSYSMLAFWCVSGSTRIYDWDRQEYTSVAKAYKNGISTTACYDEESGKTIPGKVKSVIQSGRKDLYTVRTASAKKLRCTMEHQILTPEGYKPLSGLKAGDLVAVEKRHSSAGRSDVREKIRNRGLDYWNKVPAGDRKSRTASARSNQDAAARWGKMSQEAKEAKSRQWILAAAEARGFPKPGACGEDCYGANELPVCAWMTKNGISHQHQVHVCDGRIADFLVKGVYIEVAQYPGSKSEMYRELYGDEPYEVVTAKNFKDELHWLLEEEHMRAGDEAVFEKIVSIEFWKNRPCYDIVMEEAPHNFLANGVVVHNCMWLKIHYPLAFYAASLRKEGDEKKLLKLIKDAQAHGLRVVPPDLERSGVTWEVDPDTDEIVAGFTQVKGIGPKMAEEIIRDRAERGAFAGWHDLLRVKGVGPAKLAVIRDFAESDDPFGLERVSRMLKAVRAAELPLPAGTHGSDALGAEEDVKRVVWWGVVGKVEYKDLLEDLRAKTGAEPEEILRTVRAPRKLKSATLHCYDDGGEDVYLRVNRWQFHKFRKQIESIRPDADVVVAVGEKRRAFGVSLQLKRLYVVDPEL